MNIDMHQLEMNVNLHSLQPNFLNSELHYVIASDENKFRFARWDDEPADDEVKLYCFLVDKELHMPAGNVTLKESYVLDTKPAYPLATNGEDFIVTIESMGDNGAAKCIRRFKDDATGEIRQALQSKYGNVEHHLVKSPEWQHLLFVLDDVEISVASNMVYFKQKVQYTKEHYDHIKQEQAEQ